MYDRSTAALASTLGMMVGALAMPENNSILSTFTAIQEYVDGKVTEWAKEVKDGKYQG